MEQNDKEGKEKLSMSMKEYHNHKVKKLHIRVIEESNTTRRQRRVTFGHRKKQQHKEPY